jgi:hypothetical protein
VEFDAGWNILKDEGGVYDGNHWQREPERRYPYLIREAVKMKIQRAVWTLAEVQPGKTYTVKGTGPVVANGEPAIEFGPVEADLEGNTLTIEDIEASGAFEASKVQFFPHFTIEWEIKCGDGDYKPAGDSSNPIYVCLAGPSSVAVPYRTVVHLACSNSGATDDDTAVENTWALFSGRNVETWDGRELYYYEPGTHFPQNPESLAGLLSVGTARCPAWRDFFRAAVALNGAQTNRVAVFMLKPDGTQWLGFFVENWSSDQYPPWSYKSPVFSAQPPPPFWNDMGPWPANGQYGDVRSQEGLKGQNSDTPSQKIFDRHQIAKYKDKYYDPSYGVTYDGKNDFFGNVAYVFSQVQPWSNFGMVYYEVAVLDPSAAGATVDFVVEQ